MSIQCIVGLQNFSPEYAPTRHNVGAWFVQALAEKEHLSFKMDKKLQGAWATLAQEDISTKIFLPSTFMNHSGQAVRAMCDFYRIEPHELLVVHDDLDLVPGRLQLKTGGGHGGHNGLRDIIRHLNSPMFHRLRIGIGHPGHKDQVVDYVLARPSTAERTLIMSAVDRASMCWPMLCREQFEEAKQRLHGSL